MTTKLLRYSLIVLVSLSFLYTTGYGQTYQTVKQAGQRAYRAGKQKIKTLYTSAKQAGQKRWGSGKFIEPETTTPLPGQKPSAQMKKWETTQKKLGGLRTQIYRRRAGEQAYRGLERGVPGTVAFLAGAFITYQALKDELQKPYKPTSAQVAKVKQVLTNFEALAPYQQDEVMQDILSNPDKRWITTLDDSIKNSTTLNAVIDAFSNVYQWALAKGRAGRDNVRHFIAVTDRKIRSKKYARELQEKWNALRAQTEAATL